MRMCVCVCVCVSVSVSVCESVCLCVSLECTSIGQRTVLRGEKFVLPDHKQLLLPLQSFSCNSLHFPTEDVYLRFSGELLLPFTDAAQCNRCLATSVGVKQILVVLHRLRQFQCAFLVCNTMGVMKQHRWAG